MKLNTKTKLSGSGFFPLIKSFRSTTIFKAFILNALAVAIIATLSVEIRALLEDESSQTYLFFNNVNTYFTPNTKKLSEIQKIFIVFFLTLFFAFIAYNFLYLLFHYGGGMIASSSSSSLKYF